MDNDEELESQTITIGRLYDDYVRFLKRMFGFSLRRKKLDCVEVEEVARSTYLQVRELRARIEAKREFVSPAFIEFVKYFDLASGCLAVYMSSKIMHGKGLLTL